VRSELLRRAALELVPTFLAAGERATLPLELLHAYSWESRGGVVLRGIVVNLVDWLSRVDNMGLNGL